MSSLAGDFALPGHEPPTLIQDVLCLLDHSRHKSPEDVVFSMQNVLGEDPDVNVNRLMMLQHLVLSWNGSIAPSFLASPTVQTSQTTTVAPMIVESGVCYALGRLNFRDMWFKVKIIGSRLKAPHIKVLYLSCLDGNSLPECLPSPSRDYVYETRTQPP